LVSKRPEDSTVNSLKSFTPKLFHTDNENLSQKRGGGNAISSDYSPSTKHQKKNLEAVRIAHGKESRRERVPRLCKPIRA